MNNEQNPIIVGLDIGTTKIAAIAGRKNEFGKLEILGFGRANSNGVKHGQVLNIDETIKAIKLALENCYASNPDLEIGEVYVGIAGHHIKSLQTRGDIVRQQTDDEITQAEIDQLIADQYKTYIPAGDQIIDVIPQEFTVDNFQNIPNPSVMEGESGCKFPHHYRRQKRDPQYQSRGRKKRFAHQRPGVATTGLSSRSYGTGRP
jgi:cell division protein FtsA